MPQQRWYKSEPHPLTFTEQQIDEQAGILRGVVMCQVGPAKGHGVHLEQSFINALGAYAAEHLSNNNGLKARFGHPAMSDSAMGTQMGYFRDIRVKGEQLVGDLYLLQSAELSPKAPGMRSWMLSMAKEATDFVMASIAFKQSGQYQYDPETGEKIRLAESERGGYVPQFPNERIYVEFDPSKGARFGYTDLVESGAATESLFSAEMNPSMYAVRAAEFVRENPDILAFLQENPQTLLGFAEKLDINVEPKKQNVFKQLKEFFQSQPDKVSDAAVLATQLAEIDELKQKLADSEAANKVLSQDLAANKETYAEEAAQWAESTRVLELELKTLKESPATPPAQYEQTPPAAGNDLKRFHCPTTQKAIKRHG